MTELFAPGRINIIGEHTDYNGGRALPCSLAIGLNIEVRDLSLHTGAQVALLLKSGKRFEKLSFNALNDLVDQIPKSTGQSVLIATKINKYVAGALAYFTLRHRLPRGVEIRVESSLPSGAGLSSSAALCCGLIAALCKHFEVVIDPVSIARDAMCVEHYFAGTRCGMMDQLAVLMGQKNHLLSMDFSHEPPSLTPYPIDKLTEIYDILIFHTGKTHALAESEYNNRRQSCERGLGQLNQALGLSFGTLGEFWKVHSAAIGAANQADVKVWLSHNVPLCGERDRRRLAHALYENTRVEHFLIAAQSGDFITAHESLCDSHESLRSEYEVSCVELDIACKVLQTAAHGLGITAGLDSKRTPAILGGRMTGGGFGGCTIQFVHKSLVQILAAQFRDSQNPYTEATKLMPIIYITQPHNGIVKGLQD